MHIKCLDNPNHEHVDVIITTVPWTDSAIPLMAPASLKPVVEQTGLSCIGIDINIEIYNMTKNHPHRDDLIRFFFDGVGSASADPWLEDMFESIVRGMLSWSPKFIGLSLFSYVSRNACEWLAYYIKKYSPETTVMIGGAGCLEQFTGPSTFADSVLSRGIVDYHVRGDGEHALVELLKGNYNYPGINSVTWKEIDREGLAKLPHPDYSNYNFSQYKKKMLGIHGSRGCVRACTFCDYIANWTKFHWRTADDIFGEMQTQYQKFGIRAFKFHDTLINGNLKEFNRLIELIANHNRANPDQSFRWGGYYIFREKSANDDRMWQLIAESGAEVLSVGIENLNEDIRYAIGKKFSNESIDYHLEQALKHGVRLDLLFIVGYVTETQQHIDAAKAWLDSHVKFKDILIFQWGGSLGIFPNTWLSNHREELGVVMIGDKPNLWVNPAIDSTPAQRAQWVKDLTAHSERLGYNVVSHLDNHFILEQLINVQS